MIWRNGTSSIIGCFLLISLLQIGGVDALAQGQERRAYAEGEIIVKMSHALNMVRGQNGLVASGVNAIDNLTAQGHLQEVKPLFPHFRQKAGLSKVTLPGGSSVTVPSLSGIYRVKLSPDVDISSVILQLKNDPSVVFAEPNYIAHAAGVPNDPLYTQQWALRKIKADLAWDITTGDSTVVVGVLDTGIDPLQEDLAGNIATNGKEIEGNGIDDDGNGYVDDLQGWNVVAQNNNPGDDAGHGTHVAGIVGAVTNDAIGVAGVAWHVRLLPVKVLDCNGQGLYSDIAEGILYAASNGANVINMSLGGYYPSTLLESALLNAYSSSLLVAAAGNDGVTDPYYPAAYPMVLAVAGTDSTDQLWSGSNYGPWVKLTAPASRVVSTLLANSYGELSGTSMAAPFVAGAGALLLSHDRTLDPRSLFSQLLTTSDRIDSLNSNYAGLIGTGRLNVFNALSSPNVSRIAVSHILVGDGAPDGNGNGILEAGETANLTVTLRNDGRSLAGLSGQLSTDDSLATLTQSSSLFGSLSSRDSVTNQTPFILAINSSTPNDHDVILKLAIKSGAAPVDTLLLSLRVKKEYSLSGLISTNTTWTRDKQYVVTGNMLVMSGVTLTILPGVVVKFNAGTSLRVDGTLHAVGTALDSIRFVANSPSAGAGYWNGIDYRGSGASVGAGWNYVSGSILQYVSLRQAVIGLKSSNGGTPYISDISIADGVLGISSTAPFVVRQSTILRCGVGISALGEGSGLVENVTIQRCDSGMVVQDHYSSGISYIRGCTISDNFTLGLNCQGSSAELENNIIQNTRGNGLLMEDTCTIRNCRVIGNSGWGIFGGNKMKLLDNEIVGNGSGGISGNRLLVQRNRIEGNGGWGIMGVGTIDHNLLCGNVGGIHGEWGVDTIVSNTIVGNGNPAQIEVKDGFVAFNNIIAKGGYGARSLGTGSVSMPSNWWGSASADTIDGSIYDFFDDFNLGPIIYTPLLNGPSSSAPGYIAGVVANPPSPVGVQTVTITLQFSRAMDTPSPSIALVSSAGTRFPVSLSGAWIDNSHYRASVKIDDMFPNGTYVIEASGGRDSLGFDAPVDSSQRLIVYTAGSASRELRATAVDGQIRLSWRKSVALNLLGYNIYRGTKAGGPYTKWNKSVIVDTTFLDNNFPVSGTYYYTYTILDGNFRESPQSEVASASGLAGVSSGEELPRVFSLAQNYPNPFNPSTTIQYGVPHRSQVALTVHNILGQQVATLVNGEVDAGYQSIHFDGGKLASGVYFYRLQAEGFVQTMKLLLLR